MHPYIRRRNGRGTGELPVGCAWGCAGQNAWGALVSGASHANCHRRCRIHTGRGRSACACIGDVQKHRAQSSEFRERFMRGMLKNGYDARFCRALFFSDRGVWRIRVSRKPCRQFRTAGLRLSAWIKRHHPGIFACALVERSPWGFMPLPRLCVTRGHGVEVRPFVLTPAFGTMLWNPMARGVGVAVGVSAD